MRWVIVLLLASVVPTSGYAQTPQASPQASPVASDCGWIDSYMTFYRSAVPERGPDEWRVIEKWRNGDITYETARPSEARILSAFFDDLASNLERVPASLLPPAVVDFHTARIRLYSLFASGYNAVANGDVFAVMVYAEQEGAVRDAIATASDVIEQACGERWISYWEEVQTGRNLIY